LPLFSPPLEQEDQLRGRKMQKLGQNIREGLDRGPSAEYNSREIKRAAGVKKSPKRPKRWPGLVLARTRERI
jgi:hypothetical protein